MAIIFRIINGKTVAIPVGEGGSLGQIKQQNDLLAGTLKSEEQMKQDRKNLFERQKEILRELKQQDTLRLSSGRGMSNLGEPFKVSKPSAKLTDSTLIRMQRDAGVRG